MQRQREFSRLSLVESMSRRGSSVVEQPIRNRQVASSTLALGSNIPLFPLIVSLYAHALAMADLYGGIVRGPGLRSPFGGRFSEKETA
jgi:hypothetical protein